MTNDEKNIEDQEFDAVFREAARSHSSDFQESDWLAMSELLDKNPINESTNNSFKFRKRWLLALLVGLSVLSSFGWFYVSESSKNVMVNQAEMALDLNEKNERGTISGNIDFQVPNKPKLEEYQVEKPEENELIPNANLGFIKEGNSSGNKSFLPSIEAKRAVVRNEERINVAKKEGEFPYVEKAKAAEAEKVSINEFTRASVNQLSEVLRSNLESKTSEKAAFGSKVKSVTPPFISIELNEANNRTKFVIIKTIKSQLPQLFIEKYLPEIKLTNAVEEIAAAASNTSAVFREGLSVRLAYSPDLSTVNSDFFKIGGNSAFLVEYRFNNRFVVQSGVIKSVKKYSATPADYRWPEQWGKMPNSLTDIAATCDMLDIPLNLRFDISQRQNQRFFVTAGTTNYLMLNELYEYGYYGSSGTLLSSWEGKTGFYTFSVLNFSAGFEKSISKKISLQVEPFIKLPVRDLGFGKVRLTTLGIFASAKIKL